MVATELDDAGDLKFGKHLRRLKGRYRTPDADHGDTDESKECHAASVWTFPRKKDKGDSEGDNDEGLNLTL